MIIQPPDRTTNRGFLFLPGALVHHDAYAPILTRLAKESGSLCVCVKPPFRNAGIWASHERQALSVMNQFPHIKSWTFSGHSMGAFGAARVASASCIQRDERFSGLVMWAGVCTKFSDVDLSETKIHSLTILASEDSVVPPDGNSQDGSSIRDSFKRFHPPRSKLVVIKGGNHCGFGTYGPQKFPHLERPRTISLDDQHAQIVSHTVQFLK